MNNQNLNLFDKLFVGIQVLDADNNYIYVNSFFVKQMDRNKKNFLGKEFQIVSPILESNDFLQKINFCKKKTN